MFYTRPIYLALYCWFILCCTCCTPCNTWVPVVMAYLLYHTCTRSLARRFILTPNINEYKMDIYLNVWLKWPLVCHNICNGFNGQWHGCTKLNNQNHNNAGKVNHKSLDRGRGHGKQIYIYAVYMCMPTLGPPPARYHSKCTMATL